MSNGTLTLQVMGGLCSRLRAVLGAIGYCEATNRQLVINWPRHQPNLPQGFEARFSDIWDHPYEETDRSTPQAKKPDALKQSGDVKFRTCEIDPFLPWCREPVISYLSRLAPTQKVLKVIESVNLPDTTVGVLIRDDMKQPNTVGLEWFSDRMQSILSHQPDASFFVCAGKPETIASLSQFPVVTTAKTYRYDHGGIINQAAELYLLGKCRWIVGSNASSFSQLAGMLAGGEYAGGTKVKGGRYEDAATERRFEDCR